MKEQEKTSEEELTKMEKKIYPIKSLRWDLYVYLLFITLYFCLLIKIFSSPNTEYFPNPHGKIHTGRHQALT